MTLHHRNEENSPRNETPPVAFEEIHQVQILDIGSHGLESCKNQHADGIKMLRGRDEQQEQDQRVLV
jgi:hypothetical protein